MAAGTSNFYVTGGTLPQDAPSYVERRADRDLMDGLLNGEFCYVLTSRQMGKSSLMVRTTNKLRIKGVNVVSLDLTAIGQNLTPEQWYDGLVTRMGRQLRLEDELDAFWKKSERISPVQRLISAIRDIAMGQRPGPLVIFVDEIDTVRSLPFSTDEFFSAIRECYNRRAEDSDFHRLTFCLLGVATPSDLIRDTRTTPFNIGTRIELNDFTPGEAAPLANGLGRETRGAAALLERILHWTGGHPYLTQRLCQAIADDSRLNGLSGVDRLCESLFLSNRARERDDNLLFVRERLLRSEADLASLLSLYDQVRSRRRVCDDETNPLISLLRLSGIVRVVEGYLEVRNSIYNRVFDRAWITANLPDQELVRQRAAFRKGLLRGAAVAAAFVIVAVGLSWFVTHQIEIREARRAVTNLGAAYNRFSTYQDTAELRQEFGMEGTKISTSGAFAVAMKKPNKLNMSLKLRRGIMDMDMQVVSDGREMVVWRPDLNEYTVQPAPDSLSGALATAGAVAAHEMDLTVYGLIAAGATESPIARRATNLAYLSKETFDGTPCYVLTWTEQVRDPSASAADQNQPSPTKPLAVKVRVGSSDGLIRQIILDFSQVNLSTSMPNFYGRSSRMVKLEGFVTTMNHSGIRLNESIDDAAFAFKPPANARRVERLTAIQNSSAEPTSTDTEPQFDRSRLSQLIPQRAAGTPANCLDLTQFYNAPLTEPWHSQRAGNTLAELPRGLQTFADTQFDARGVIQLAGHAEPYLIQKYPKQVAGIPVERKCRRLHFLHGTGWTAPEGTPIGHYVIHFADRQQRAVPILYGFDVRNWWTQENESPVNTGLILAWTGSNDAIKSTHQKLRLYKSTWANPLAGIEIESIDYVSSLADPAPFLIAITAE